MKTKHIFSALLALLLAAPATISATARVMQSEPDNPYYRGITAEN